MAVLRLRAVDPNRLSIVDLDDKVHRSGSSAQGLKAGEEATGERVAWVCETALSHGVVLWIIAEREGVANIGLDNARIENESAVADAYGNVGGKARSKDGEERDREGGLHIDVLSTESGEDLNWRRKLCLGFDLDAMENTRQLKRGENERLECWWKQ